MMYMADRNKETLKGKLNKEVKVRVQKKGERSVESRDVQKKQIKHQMCMRRHQ